MCITTRMLEWPTGVSIRHKQGQIRHPEPDKIGHKRSFLLDVSTATGVPWYRIAFAEVNRFGLGGAG